MDKERIHRILKLRLEKKTINYISKKLNLSETTISDGLKIAYNQSDSNIKKQLDEIAYKIKSKYKEDKLSETLKLRLQNKSINEIAKLMKCEPSTINWRLKEVYKQNNAKINKQLDEVAHIQQHKKKDKITFYDLSDYQLGIFWGIGSYVKEEDAVTFKDRRKHFVKIMESITDSNMYEQITSKGKIQYVLKSCMFDINSFILNGWTERKAKVRDIPPLEEYNDFLRAYIELHSSLDYSIRYSRNKKNKWKSLRFRIYGNWQLIDSVNNILNTNIGVTLKTPQKASNEVTKILNYTSLKEIKNIFNWLTDNREYHNEYWDDVDIKLKNPTKEM